MIHFARRLSIEFYILISLQSRWPDFFVTSEVCPLPSFLWTAFLLNSPWEHLSVMLLRLDWNTSWKMATRMYSRLRRYEWCRELNKRTQRRTGRGCTEVREGLPSSNTLTILQSWQSIQLQSARDIFCVIWPACLHRLFWALPASQPHTPYFSPPPYPPTNPSPLRFTWQGSMCGMGLDQATVLK